MNPHTLELIAKAKARHAELQAARAKSEATRLVEANKVSLTTVPVNNTLTAVAKATMKTVSGIELNEKQAEAVERGMRGQSFCLIGAAGTGKTTTTQELITTLQQASHMMPFKDSSKWLSTGTPGFVIVGYTNKAVNNIKKRLPKHLQNHCITIHKLIEYAPEYFNIVDDQGNERTTMRFTPSRNGANPLPHISTIIFEEASMIGTDLYGQVLDALPRPAATQYIFLGDIFQLPPVFGHSILGFKMAELPVVELTHVYRQALLSPIISLATAVRTDSFNGFMKAQQHDQAKLTTNICVDAEEHGKLTLNPWKKRISAAGALKTFGTFITGMLEKGTYNIDEDQILCPFNVSFGTVEINNLISDYLAKKNGETVYEVIARFRRSYWAVGDRVMVDRHEARIVKIEKTIGYIGAQTKTASKTLNRWGKDPVLDGADDKRSADEILNEIEMIEENDENGKNLASHTITVYFPDFDEERKLNTAGEINSLIFSYCLTVHKSQGSEWKRVFIVLHSTHQTMCSRELLYTAITRAREELFIICEGDIAPYKNQLLTGSNRAVVPGITLADKIEFFQGKRQAMSNGTNGK
jgi:exodeoxyribonuclease V alpha subunit